MEPLDVMAVMVSESLSFQVRGLLRVADTWYDWPGRISAGTHVAGPFEVAVCDTPLTWMHIGEEYGLA